MLAGALGEPRRLALEQQLGRVGAIGALIGGCVRSYLEVPVLTSLAVRPRSV